MKGLCKNQLFYILCFWRETAGEPREQREGRGYLSWTSSLYILSLSLIPYMIMLGGGRLCVGSLTETDPHFAACAVLTAKQSHRRGCYWFPVTATHKQRHVIATLTDGHSQVPRGAGVQLQIHTCKCIHHTLARGCSQTDHPAAYHQDFHYSISFYGLALLNCVQRKSYLKPLQGQTYDNMTFHSCPVNGSILAFAVKC